MEIVGRDQINLIFIATIVTSLVRVIGPISGIKREYSPLIKIILCIIATIFLFPKLTIPIRILNGVVAGLMAIGTFDGVKGMADTVKEERSKRKTVKIEVEGKEMNCTEDENGNLACELPTPIVEPEIENTE